MCDGRAEDRDHGVSDELLDRPAEPLELGTEPRIVGRQHRPDVLRVEGLRPRREPDEIREQHRHDLPLLLRRLRCQRRPATRAETVVAGAFAPAPLAGDHRSIFTRCRTTVTMGALSAHEYDEDDEELPAWSLPAAGVDAISLPATLPERVTAEWAWGGSTGAGARVCIVDSGIEAGHPLVGELEGAVAISLGPDGETIVEDDAEGDGCGHGTACAGIVRSLAPDCSLFSVRVLGKRLHRQRPHPARRPRLGDRAGLRRDQHEPLDDEGRPRLLAARDRRSRVFSRRHARCLRPQHADRELSVAILLGRLRGQPRARGSAWPSSTTRCRRSSSSHAASTSTWRGSAARRSARPGTASRRRT